MYFEPAGFGYPASGFRAVKRQVFFSKGKINCLCLPGQQAHLVEPLEFFRWSRQLRFNVTYVKLYDLFPLPFSCISNIDADVNLFTRFKLDVANSQVAVFEFGIGKAVSERKQRLDIIRIIWRYPTKIPSL